MENVKYQRMIIPAKESPDGEYPAKIQVTEEVNGVMVSADSHDGGFEFIRWYRHFELDKAIEFAVTITPQVLIESGELSEKFLNQHKA